MEQEMMKFMHELKEFVNKAERFLQSQGGDFAQRGGYYGMRDNGSQGGGYNQGSQSGQGGSYGQREQTWMQGGQGWGQQGMPNGQNWGRGGDFPPMDPRWFM